MRVKTLWLTVVALACLGLTAFAQTGRIEGDIVKKGTNEPIPNAEVEIIRTDIKGNYKASIDKKGHFLHAGVPYVGTYTLLISAPGCEPTFLTGINAKGGEPLKVELGPGDGHKITMEDLKRFQASKGAGGAGGAGGAAPGANQPSAAEIKKAQEEYEKAKAANEKAKSEHEAMKKLFDSGVAKANAKPADYAGAIADFNEAAKLDAEQYAIWANLALALYNRGVTNINESIKGDLSKRDAAKQDFTDAANATDKALALVEKDLADPAKAADAKKRKATTLKIRADARSLLAMRLGQMEMADAAFKDYSEAASLTDVPAEKISYQLKGANTYREVGKNEEAIAAYKAIIEADPENIEAYYNLGLAYSATEKTWQDSANMLQKFIDKAPATDSRVAEAKVVIGELLKGNNIQPPKSEPAKKATQAKKKP